MREYRCRRFEFINFEITKREVLASVSIIAVMLLIGILIAGKISDHKLDQNEKYNKAIKIETQELFEYGMRTNVGNAFVYGELEAVDTVTYPELDNVYMYVEKVKEEYTKHTKTVKDYDEDGNTIGTHEEIYWTWDWAGSEERTCKAISFLGHIFYSEKIKFPETKYIDTINESIHTRYSYYGVDSKFTGTIFAELKDGTIPDNTPFYKNKSIEETVEYLESDSAIVIFWIFWIVFIGFCVYGFYYVDNKWLE